MIRVSIIDDESHARRTLAKLLDQYCEGVEVVGKADGVAAGSRIIRERRPDLVFLDIKMQDGSGFDLLDQLPSVDFHLVFTTAYDQFAIRAFRYNAIDYLLKPIDPDELIDAVNKTRQQPSPLFRSERMQAFRHNIQTRELDRISLSTQKGLIILKLDEILRLESEGSYTYFHTKQSEEILVSRPLREFEDLLPSTYFFRTHQSHIISLDDVRRVIRQDGGLYAQMINGTQVPVSRRRREAFTELLERRSL